MWRNWQKRKVGVGMRKWGAPQMPSIENRACVTFLHTSRCEDERFKAEPFDVVIDCVGAGDEWKAAYRKGVLKSGWNGGRFISVGADDPQIHTAWQVIPSLLVLSFVLFVGAPVAAPAAYRC